MRHRITQGAICAGNYDDPACCPGEHARELAGEPIDQYRMSPATREALKGETLWPLDIGSRVDAVWATRKHLARGALSIDANGDWWALAFLGYDMQSLSGGTFSGFDPGLAASYRAAWTVGGTLLRQAKRMREKELSCN